MINRRGSYLKNFITVISVVLIFEGLFILHAWAGSFTFGNIGGVSIITIWAAVLTVVFLVFSIMGLFNIDNRIKELNDARDRLSSMEAEMKAEMLKFKLSAEEERQKIVQKAQAEVVKIMNKSSERQNTFDRLTQIACTPDPVGRIHQYTEILKTKTQDDGVNVGFIYCKRAEAYQEMERDDDALKDFERAVELLPDEVDPYLGLGCFYVHRKKDYNKSIEYFLKAAKVKPTLGIIYSNIANSYAAMGDYDKANEYYKIADDCGAESAEWFYNKALSIKHSGEPDPNGNIQESFYRRCLRLEPMFFRAAINLAIVYRERGEKGKAEATLTELISKAAYRPEFVNSIIQRGICTMQMNRIAEAYNDFALAYVYAPRNLFVLCNLAICSLRLMRITEANEYAHVCREYALDENNTEIVKECDAIIAHIKRIMGVTPLSFGQQADAAGGK